MSRIHDDEPDTGPDVVRRLLDDQLPVLARRPLRQLESTGSDNALYRLGDDHLVRLPRLTGAAGSLTTELSWLPRLDGRLPVRVPAIVHAGRPGAGYPHPWAVTSWIDGTDAWAARDEDWYGAALGQDLAAVVQALRACPVTDAPPRTRGQRGGPFGDLDESVRYWLDRAGGLLDVAGATRLWDACREATDGVPQPPPVLLHGDLIPGNLLVRGSRLVAVLDWGGLGAGDPAVDLDPAWSVLDERGAEAFREALEPDEQEWWRGRGIALQHALAAVVYYTPRRHPLANVMRRSLDRLLGGR